MVGVHELLYSDPFNPHPSAAHSKAQFKNYGLDLANLEVPSPPKALQRPEIERLRQERAQAASRAGSIRMLGDPSLMRSATRADLVRLEIASETAQLQRSSALAGRANAAFPNAFRLNNDNSATPTRALPDRRISPLARSVSMPSASPPPRRLLSFHPSHAASTASAQARPRPTARPHPAPRLVAATAVAAYPLHSFSHRYWRSSCSR